MQHEFIPSSLVISKSLWKIFRSFIDSASIWSHSPLPVTPRTISYRNIYFQNTHFPTISLTIPQPEHSNLDILIHYAIRCLTIRRIGWNFDRIHEARHCVEQPQGGISPSSWPTTCRPQGQAPILRIRFTSETEPGMRLRMISYYQIWWDWTSRLCDTMVGLPIFSLELKLHTWANKETSLIMDSNPHRHGKSLFHNARI